MKNISNLIFLILLSVFYACSHETKTGDITTENVNQGNNTEIENDSLLTGEAIPISLKKIKNTEPPSVIKLGEPAKDSSNKNIFRIKPPDLKLVSPILPSSIPGKGNIQLPNKVAAVGTENAIKVTRKTEALAPSSSDIAYYNLQYIDADQGLSSGYIVSIMEDTRGDLWLSTWSKGVSIYNGKFFTNLDESSGLCSNYIWDIFEDSKGNIWFGTDGSGVCMYNGQNFINYTDEDGLSGPLVKKIVEDEKENLWFATNGGLCKYDGENFITYGKKEGLGGNTVNDIFIAANNNIIVSTENGISIFDGVLFTHYSEEEGLVSNKTTVVYEDSRENIWIGTENDGVCMFDGYTFFTFNSSHGISGNSILSISEDSYNNMWFGTANNGLTKYNRSSFEHITREQGLSSNTVRSIFQDSNQNLWFGTYSGINRYTERSFLNYTDEHGLLDRVVQGICEDKNGNLWFAHSTGLSMFDGENYFHYTSKQGLTDNFIRDLLEDSSGNLWFTTNGAGVLKYDGTNLYSYTVKNGLCGNMILSIYEDQKGNIWFGTYQKGITMYDGEYFYHLSKKEGLLSNTVRAITEDKSGNMWFGTTLGGLEKFDGETITHFTKKEGLLGEDILSLIVDNKGALWIGTENYGLSRYKDSTFTHHFTDKNGLSDNMIWSLIQDFEENIWVGTEKGLNLIEEVDSLKFEITSFGKLDGLKGTDFYPNSVFLDSDNRMWWGTGKALVMLDLNKYERIKVAPKISLTDVKIKQNQVDFRALKELNHSVDNIDSTNKNLFPLIDILFDSIRPFSNCPTSLEIPYGLNEITFNFYANDWSAPHKLKYNYMLEGLDKNWHSSDNQNNAVYSFIPEGDYIFKIKAIGQSKIWSETVSFNLKVNPPWWRTLWAYIIYLLLVIFAFITFTTIRTTKLRRQRKLLEKLVKLRTQEVVKQKEIVEHKNKEIIDSINYAKRIQRAILPSSGMVKRKLANAFIFFKPKDIVAGDFYWLEERGDKILLAAADCTGHGVPGAMVSLVCNNTLSRTVREFKLEEPHEILNSVREMVIESFANSREEVNDGMDIAFVTLNTKTNLLEYAGANNDLYIISKGEIITLTADRQPIGKYFNNKPFTKKTYQLHSGDTIYMMTDGYIDQFGGPRGKKFKKKGFLELLLGIQNLEMKEQKKIIEKEFDNWKGDLEQIDDVCVIGVRVS